MKLLKLNIVREGQFGEKLGLKPGDVIFTINGVQAASPEQLSGVAPGTALSLVVLRQDKKIPFSFESQSLGVSFGEEEFDFEAWNNREALKAMILTTAPSLEDRGVLQTLGIVGGECILGVNVFADILGGLRDVTGGRSGALQKRLKEARTAALESLRDEAFDLGADAVIAITIDHSEIGDKGGFMMMVSATGTAVQLVRHV